MKILLNGICGRMGKEVEKLALTGYRGAELVGGVDPNGETASVPVFADFDSVNVDFDCIVTSLSTRPRPRSANTRKRSVSPLLSQRRGTPTKKRKL